MSCNRGSCFRRLLQCGCGKFAQPQTQCSEMGSWAKQDQASDPVLDMLLNVALRPEVYPQLVLGGSLLGKLAPLIRLDTVFALDTALCL